MDRVSKETRSKIMSKIKGRNTKPEKTLFKALRDAGLKFRTHFKMLGNPDIVFPVSKVAIFVDGGFWHGFDYEIRKNSLPDYWVQKIKRNMDRDKRYNAELKSQGWHIIRVWEHEIINNTPSVVRKIKASVYYNNRKSVKNQA